LRRPANGVVDVPVWVEAGDGLGHALLSATERDGCVVGKRRRPRDDASNSPRSTGGGRGQAPPTFLLWFDNPVPSFENADQVEAQSDAGLQRDIRRRVSGHHGFASHLTAGSGSAQTGAAGIRRARHNDREGHSRRPRAAPVRRLLQRFDMLYRKASPTPPRLLLRIVAGAGAGAMLGAVACSSSSLSGVTAAPHDGGDTSLDSADGTD